MPARTHKPLSKQDLVNTIYCYPAEPPKLIDLIVEIGPGRGDFLFHLAETNPNKTVVGIEIKRKRVDKLIRRTEKKQLKNIIIIQDDDRRALKDMFKDGAIEAIHINFPDPWPKKRHGKNRLFNEDFIHTCARKLKPDGVLYFTTDFRRYAQEVAEDLKSCPLFKSCYPELIRNESAEAFSTFFAQKWEAEGRIINYQKYLRKA